LLEPLTENQRIAAIANIVQFMRDRHWIE